MLKTSRVNEKGIMLLIVLATILVVAILANIILSLIVSQSRLTHHQVSRIQAYYAALAGINYGLEKLRTGSWVAGTNCTTGCTMSFASGDFIPPSVVGNSISITIRPAGSAGCLSPPAPADGACVSVKAIYTYAAP